MNWTTLSLSDFDFLSRHLDTGALQGSDSSLVNLFLLQKKYDIRTAIADGFLFRYYTSAENRTGYGFPLALRADEPASAAATASADTRAPADSATSSAPDGNNAPATPSLREALALIVADASEHGRAVRFCLCDAAQKDALSACLRAHFPQVRLTWHTNRDDSDYIYEREKLAALSGKTYHKKKNHVSRFLRAYEGAWEFRLLSLCHIDSDMILVAQKWLDEHFAAMEAATAPNATALAAGASPAPATPAADATERERRILQLELESIRTAVQNKEDFALEGGVLYVRGEPVAMTLASRINDRVLDVHFEKCLSQAAANGAYAAVNWCFASSCERFRYLNREEDMGVEGLRKAKLSYHPDLLVDKFYAIPEEPC